MPLAEVLKNKRDKEERQRLKAERRRKQAVVVEVDATNAAPALPLPAPAKGPDTPIAFLFPGQGSQAVGMLKVLDLHNTIKPNLT